MPTTAETKVTTDVERELLKLQLSPEDRLRIYGPGKPFDLDAWLSAGPPATAEELAEMEELLRLRDEERQASLARDAGILP